MRCSNGWDAGMNEILNEIDQELRQERMRQMWRQYGVYIIAGLSRLYFSLLEGRGWSLIRKVPAILLLMPIIQLCLMPVMKHCPVSAAGDGEGYAMLARFQLAADAANSGDKAAAEAAYLALAADESLGLVYRDAALILSVMNAADGTTADELDRRLNPVASNQGGWAMMAMELQIGVALKAGNIQRARELALNMRENLELPADANRRLQLIEAAIGE